MIGAVAFMTQVIATGAPAESRVWKSGHDSIKAEFVSLEDGKVIST